MDRLLILVIIVFFPMSIHAENKQSIMFKDSMPNQLDAAQTPPADQHAKHCTELRKKMEELKGKPQRRYAVSERYRLECLETTQ